MNKTPEITGLILAGGAGTRVGGNDKGLLRWQGKPLVAHVIARLQPQTTKLIISCNRNLEHYRTFGLPLVEDQRSGYQGPLAGIEAARPCIATPYVAIAACDTPLLPANLVDRLLRPLLQEDSSISYVYDGEREQYLSAVFKTRVLEELPSFLEQGHRAVRHWYQLNRATMVDFSGEQDKFRNYNYLDDHS